MGDEWLRDPIICFFNPQDLPQGESEQGSLGNDETQGAVSGNDNQSSSENKNSSVNTEVDSTSSNAEVGATSNESGSSNEQGPSSSSSQVEQENNGSNNTAIDWETLHEEFREVSYRIEFGDEDSSSDDGYNKNRDNIKRRRRG